jgi:NAD(P)-dependent dehydrogenase (short-subunit alcohol dehydrogenase family)
VFGSIRKLVLSVQAKYWHDRVVLVTGASTGLGRHVALRLAGLGARVAAVARSADPLQRLAQTAASQAGNLQPWPCDVTQVAQLHPIVDTIYRRHGQLDAVIHCVGRSMRGSVLDTSPEQFRESWEINFLSAVQLAQATVPHLVQRQGHFVAVGSLASRAPVPYLGAYPSSKAALALFMHQLRLEHAAQGLHALLVLPGPIARDDAGLRYAQQAARLPPAARKPGGGVRLSAIDPARLVDRLLIACQRRQPELVMPFAARLLFALVPLAPSWADRILLRKSRS